MSSNIQDRDTAVAVQRLADGQELLLQKFDSFSTHIEKEVSEVSNCVKKHEERIGVNEDDIIGLKHKTSAWTSIQLVATTILGWAGIKFGG